MDYTAIVTAIVSGLLGIGAVATFMSKYMPTVIKYSTLAKDAVETLNDLVGDLAKGQLTPDEMTKLKADVTQFKTDLAVLLGK